MACSFTIPFNGTPGALISNIKEKVLANAGAFDGDENIGKFQIHVMGSPIDGSYGICNNEIMVTIARKPIFVSCGMVKNYVMEHLT